MLQIPPDFLYCPRVHLMSEAMQRRLMMLHCFEQRGFLSDLADDAAACAALRINKKQWADTKALFIELGFIDEELNLLDWGKPQGNSYEYRRLATAIKAECERSE